MISPIIKLLRMFGLVLVGLIYAGSLARSGDRSARDRRLVAWAGRLMRILNVEARINDCPDLAGAVLVSNHVSWLDIHVLHSIFPMRFVSKAEVRDWPLLGNLARASGTLFITREKKSDAKRVNQEMAAELRAGECLAFFPEGTTSDGLGMRPFFPSLFQPAVEAGCPVIPVAIRYRSLAGDICPEVAYHGEMTLLASFWAIARLPGLVAEVTFLPALQNNGGHRRDLARQAESAIRSSLGLVRAETG